MTGHWSPVAGRPISKRQKRETNLFSGNHEHNEHTVLSNTQCKRSANKVRTKCEQRCEFKTIATKSQQSRVQPNRGQKEMNEATRRQKDVTNLLKCRWKGFTTLRRVCGKILPVERSPLKAGFFRSFFGAKIRCISNFEQNRKKNPKIFMLLKCMALQTLKCE